MRAGGVVSLTLAAALAVHAVRLAQAAPGDEARATLEQRIALTARLLSDSPTAQRIVASGHAQAAAHLDEGRLHHALSEDALRRGDLAGARKAADEALRHVAMARRLVPDAPARQAAARQRHDQLVAHLERLLENWRQRLPSPGGAGGAGGEADDGDRVAALGLLDTARAFGQSGRYEEAVHVLASAESHVLAGMNRLLTGRDLDYTQRPASPAEEFALELQRHQGLAELVPLALAELRPRGDAALLIARYGEASKALREQAVARQQGGDVAQALADLRNATLYLQRALGAAGVALPQPTGERP